MSQIDYLLSLKNEKEKIKKQGFKVILFFRVF
jgi:hypothetical protein